MSQPKPLHEGGGVIKNLSSANAVLIVWCLNFGNSTVYQNFNDYTNLKHTSILGGGKFAPIFCRDTENSDQKKFISDS